VKALGGTRPFPVAGRASPGARGVGQVRPGVKCQRNSVEASGTRWPLPRGRTVEVTVPQTADREIRQEDRWLIVHVHELRLFSQDGHPERLTASPGR
jgi:hypothetical protein